MEGEQLSSHAIYYQRAASADPKSRLIELRLKPEAGTFIIGSPETAHGNHFGRHADKETGVAPWFKTFELKYDFVYAGTGKKGGY